ncbi:ribosomal-processing cysteine protease Prp [Bombilactobacillus folatiphilus]|uniref:Ribosomal processing cysteine protease Prp n=1 Tax=Bombilactobacillus folatiphilus TaxID=2923362 RepID=A0ABY4P7L6_9LACO|nr:ribosomal-processing cysteine protease Prp [Bombilactobacillus folatiphilus]UQS81632.1 ribosomal-processing cysteine protease Prp [Bombilactobacillus folatiphilus]
MTGHADYDVYGQDIVCAAVSVISLGTVNSLQTLAKVQPVVRSDTKQGGFLECFVDYAKIIDHDQLIVAQTLMANCYEIVQSLVNNYADFIQVELQNE